jgi:hypothetical protein
MNRITFGKATGPSDERAIDVFLDGEPVGEIVTRTAIRFRPAKRIDFDSVTVTLWDLDTDTAFAAPEYDAAGALRAAKAWVKAVLA